MRFRRYFGKVVQRVRFSLVRRIQVFDLEIDLTYLEAAELDIEVEHLRQLLEVLRE
jgi:hypothetical protein